MKVLLDVCCAPCATFPFRFLQSQGHAVTAFFADANIYPEEELAKRRDVFISWADSLGLPHRVVPVNHADWVRAVSEDAKKPARCRLCYRYRARLVAGEAAKLGMEAFTTSLLISPYQDHESVNEAMEEASRAFGVPFLYHDFRRGYIRSREMARGTHLYMQKYCGCEWSLRGE